MGERPQGCVLIRADADETIGSGHIMRCLALCEEWRGDGDGAHFASTSIDPALVERLRRTGFGVTAVHGSPGSDRDARDTIAIARDLNARWIVIDGYTFGADYQIQLKDANLRVLVIDDFGHSDFYHADIVVNQNITARENLYQKRRQRTQLLLGTPYVLLRTEFSRWRNWNPQARHLARRLLLTFGGADLNNFTMKCLSALDDPCCEEIELLVVVGGSNPRFAEIRNQLERHPCRHTLLHDVQDMSQIMAQSDIALAAGGSACWEMAFMGLPAMLVIAAENQRAVVDCLDAQQTAISLGDAATASESNIRNAVIRLSRDSQLRQLLSSNSRALIDGFGASRVVAAMRGKHDFVA